MAETIQHHSDNLESMVRSRTKELEAEKQTSERLLLNVLPAPIAARLKHGEGVIVDRFDDVSVLFADIVGFTALSARTSPESLVAMLDDLFTRFDALADRHGLEKIKTIGDAYMVVAGVPEQSADHAIAMARMGLDMQVAIADYARGNAIGADLTIRIGIHSGPVVAGVIGRNKFIYDLWGDTVNTASRMESHGMPSRVHVTEATRAALHGRFECESRGVIDVKGKGPMTTYFLVRELEERELPPPAAPPAPPTLEELGIKVARRTVVASGPGGRDTTELSFTLPLTTAVRATFAREGLGRKLSKFVKKELQTGDRAFDDAVYIATDTEASTRALLASDELREAIAAVVALAGSVEIEGTTVTIALPTPDGAELAAADRLARALI
jgi:class 3 adenylate cyclase